MSIDQVAQVAGVSKATVSRVINGKRNVSVSTQAVVRKAIDKVGYSPISPLRKRGLHSNALGNRGIRNGNIAVVWFEQAGRLAATHFVRSVQSISEALAEYGLNMIFSCAMPDKPLPPALIESELDGMIVIVGEPDAQLAEELGHIPSIWLSSRHTNRGDYVVGGNEIIGQLAARYLADHSHRQLVFINPLANHPALRARKEGFQFEAFKQGLEVISLENGSEHSDKLMFKSLEELDHAIEPLVERLSQINERPVGVFVPGDSYTASVYRHLYKAGLKPGEQFKIISADHELPFLAGLYPRPATIDIGIELNAKHAVEQLIWRMRNPDSKRKIIITIEPRLVEGDCI